MSVEVKQLIIKGTMQEELGSGGQQRATSLDLAKFREQLLQDCRREMEQILRQRNER